MANPLPPPIQTVISRPRNWNKYPNPKTQDPQEGLVDEAWANYFVNNGQQIQASPQFPSIPVSLTAQTATIGTTSIPTNPLSAGVYRVTIYARVTTPASVSSSLQVTIIWTDGGVTQGDPSAAATGNTTTTWIKHSGSYHIDANTPLSYSTTYASVGTAMQYSIFIICENLNG